MVAIFVLINLSFGLKGVNTEKSVLCICTDCSGDCTSKVGCYSMKTYDPKTPLIVQPRFRCLNDVSLFIYSFLMLLVIILKKNILEKKVCFY